MSEKAKIITEDEATGAIYDFLHECDTEAICSLLEDCFGVRAFYEDNDKYSIKGIDGEYGGHFGNIPMIKRGE